MIALGIVSAYVMMWAASIVLWLAHDTRAYVRETLEKGKSANFPNPPINDFAVYLGIGLFWPLGWLIFFAMNCGDWLKSIEMFDGAGKLEKAREAKAKAERDSRELEDLKRELEQGIQDR